jgi:3-oxoacyl-[acyl-carrier-protein] synthase II
MTRRVVITGSGVISPLGDSPAALHSALIEGRSRPRPVDLFRTDGLVHPRAFAVQPFSPETYLGDRNFRPLDRTSRLLTCAAQRALADSGWTPERLRDREVGLVVGTMFCSVHTIAEFDRRALQEGPGYASPMAFANTVINAAAGQAAIWHNLRGVNSTVSTGAASGLQALAQAAELIRSGRAQALLAGGVEELCFESYYGFSRAGLLSASRTEAGDPPRSFDARRNGFVLGEGAALVMVEDAAAAAARGATILAEIKGHGFRFDCSRGTRTGQAVAGIQGAMHQALRDAGLTSSDIDGVSASANGSVQGDRHEALALKAVFADRDDDLAVTTVKSLAGEALGASGALQVVALLETMRRGTWPGIPELEQIEENFLRGKVSPTSRDLTLRTGLVNSVGYDGHCCSLVLVNGC